MSPSKPEITLLDLLQKTFPQDVIVQQMPIKVGRKTLFVDFVIKDKKLAFEIDGKQHSEYTEHFHGDAEGFKAAKYRDLLKAIVLEDLGYTLIRISHKDKLTLKSLRKKLIDAL
jgi:very-short-patch-repair endonuclease